MNKRIFAIQISIVVFVLFVFYISFKIIFDSIDRYNISVIKKQILFSLSDDIAEGNLFKLGYTFSKLEKEGIISNGLIVEIKGKEHRIIYQISGSEGFYNYYKSINCKLIKNNDIIRKVKNDETALITKLPYNFDEEKCQALLIKYSQSREIRSIYLKGMVIFLFLTLGSIGILLTLSNMFYKKLLYFKLEKQKLLYEKEIAFGNLSAQVAHDIRSPLAALETVLNKANQLPQEYRIMASHAINRIRDIANNLLEKYKVKGKTILCNESLLTENKNLPDVYLISSLIERVVNEKRLEFEDKANIQIELELTEDSYGLFSKIEPPEFNRIISNLINNAVEAIESEGFVKVSLTHNEKEVIIKLTDNGKGIPPEILAKLTQKGVSYGKIGGSGLGLYHARTNIESWGGSLNIGSEIGKGTEVTVKLPKASAPEGFITELRLNPGQYLIILDDDISIHNVWDRRLESVKVKGYDIEIIHFTEPDKLIKWIEVNRTKADRAKYIFDYELKHRENGIDIAKNLNITDKTILVTSYYGDEKITQECHKYRIGMIPKWLIDIVPIKIDNNTEITNKVDAILIDDDKLTQMNWKLEARLKGKKLIIFDNPKDFLSQLNQFPKNTSIYIDSELGNIKGEDIAKELHDKGYTDITLETGHNPERFSNISWLKVIDKASPWK